ncbi:hypothetical protein IQ22_00662 [Pseudomonas duriflava]|uniref:Uncharacterized protein n=1 Tax=Pseudomonas duriflava TaxID=459528 RepID=A0A562QN07_9PSED|nr:hypothetical protein [Pseudomonas duriflava]TWI57446.1 hypothetical protein IQ22_00662 [Pseudomonas duriflava]
MKEAIDALLALGFALVLGATGMLLVAIVILSFGGLGSDYLFLIFSTGGGVFIGAFLYVRALLQRS